MTYLNINLKLEELTEAVLNSDMNTLMKSLAITVFNAYMEEERQWSYPSVPLNYKSHIFTAVFGQLMSIVV